MPVIALVAWILTALGGLFLLAIWLIEYDPDFQRAAATRLPVPVIVAHVLLAVGGLIVWIGYIVTDDKRYAWVAVGVLAGIVTFGLTMAVRWIGVYRARVEPVPALARPGRHSAPAALGQVAVPPERHFPLSVVIAHGVLAVTTVVLVLATTLGVSGS